MRTDCVCRWCHKSIRYEGSFRGMFQIDDVLCQHCRSQMSIRQGIYGKDNLRFEGMYVYEGVVRDMILQYKENYDEALFSVFLYPYVRQLKRKYRKYTVVPVPSSTERIRERGFRHVDRMFSLLDLPLEDLLIKTDNVEQKYSYHRERIAGHFRLADHQIDSHTPILLVDDIVTTGASMSACYALLRQKYDFIRCFSVCFSAKFVKNALLFTNYPFKRIIRV